MNKKFKKGMKTRKAVLGANYLNSVKKNITSTTPSCGGPLRAQKSPVASFHMPALPQIWSKMIISYNISSWYISKDHILKKKLFLGQNVWPVTRSWIENTRKTPKNT